MTRCENHVGEPYAPRCASCDREGTHAPSAPCALPQRRIYKRYIPGSECPLHRGYPVPCDACERAEGSQ